MNQAHGLALDGIESRVELAAERPQLHRGHERRAAAGVHQAHRHPARPRHEHRLAEPVAGFAYGVPVGRPEVQVELRRRRRQAVVLAVVVAVVGHHTDEVLGPGDGGQRVAVPYAGGEAPDRQVAALPLALFPGQQPVVLTGVDVRAVGDVDDAGALSGVAAALQAAVDAYKASCTHEP